MSQTDLSTLFSDAEADGDISPDAAAVINVVDIGQQIQAGLGVSVDDVLASEVVLVTQLIDDSSSIAYNNNTKVVCDGHNLVIEALEGSKQNDGILAHATALNSGVLYPYQSIDPGIRLGMNYQPQGNTPLYDQTIVTLATVLAKSKEFTDNGVACRTVTLIVTDGDDIGSKCLASLLFGQVKMPDHLVRPRLEALQIRFQIFWWSSFY